MTKEVTLKELYYYMFFGILAFAKGIGLYDGQKIFVAFLLAAGVFWMLKICLTKHTLKEWLLMGVLLLIAGLSYLNNGGDKSPVIAVMVVVGMKGIPLKRLFKVGAAIWGCTFVGTVTASLLGIWPTVELVHDKGFLGYVVRDSLGMTHPNVLHISYLVLIGYLFLAFDWKGKAIIKPILLSLLGSVYIFIYSLSYTGFLFFIAYVILIVYFNLPRKITKGEEILVQCLMPFCVLFSLVGPLVLKGRAFEIVNKMVNTRFWLSRNYLTTVKLRLLGQPMFVEGSYSIDNSYLYCLYYYGVILFACFMLGMFFLNRYLVKKKRYQELALVLGQTAAGFTEPFLFNFAFKNLILPVLGEYFFILTEKYAFQGKLNWLEKEIRILPFDRKVADCGGINTGRVGINTGHTDRNKKWIAGLVSGVIIGAICCFFLPEPEPYIIAEKTKCDRVGGKYDYLIYEDISPEIKEDCAEIGNLQEDTQVYVFSGSTIEYQEFRNHVSLIVYGGVCGVLLMLLLPRIYPLLKRNPRKKDA